MGKGKSVVVGYRYYMGVHAALCHGPVDEVSELIFGERSGWSGSVTSSGTINVDNPSLFGGDDREGGVSGQVDVMMGEPGQAVNPYLSSNITGPVPAYRGILTAVFRTGVSQKGFLWSSMNPYFKSPWFRLKRVLKGWSRGAPWYPTTAVINSLDMNPAHIVYECYTDQNWGMGYNPDDIDDANFKAVADTLYSEGFGLSLLWLEQDSIGNFIDHVLKHVDGVRRYDISTGKLQIKLIRNDYSADSLPELNASNIVSVDSFQRPALADLINEVTVRYTDREQQGASLTVHNLALIDAQNATIGVTRDYPGIRDGNLASRVAMRDLITASSPLAKVTLRCNRIAWNWLEGDVFKLSWGPLDINGTVYRVVKIDKGTLVNGEISIEAVEDVFQTPSTSYVSAPVSGWTDPRSLPAPVTTYKLVEAPYWDIVRNTSSADFDYLQPGWAFAELFAKKPTSDATYFAMMHSPDGSVYSSVSEPAQFSPVGVTSEAIPVGAANIDIVPSSATDIDAVEAGDYFYIDNEAFGVVSISSTGVITASRGVIDTVPADHAAGAVMFFAPDWQAIDRTERSIGEVARYRALTVTGRGKLTLADAPTLTISMAGRAHKPYPPGNLKVNGVAYPSTVTVAPATVTWSHRDRTQQTVDLVPTNMGNIGPESGTSYFIRARKNGIVTDEYSQTGTSHKFGRGIAVGLHMDGVDNGTSFPEINGKTVNRFGNTKTVTAVKHAGTASAYFDGAGSYLELPVASSLPYGTEDFAIAMRVNIAAYPASSVKVIYSTGGSGIAYINFEIRPDGKLGLWLGATSTYIVSSTTVPLGTFNHLAVFRVGNTFIMTINGVVVGSVTSTAPMYPAAHWIGRDYGATSDRFFVGYVDEFYMFVGASPYTGDFTPPSAAFSNDMAIISPGTYSIEVRSVVGGNYSMQALSHSFIVP